MIQLMQIRQYVVQLLKNAAIPRILDNVYDDRSIKMFPDELPAICVYTRRTTFSGEDRQPRYYQSETELVVESIVRGDYDPGDGQPVQGIAEQLNRLSEAIIQALIYPWDSDIRTYDQPPVGPFDGLASDIILTGISSDTSSDGEQIIGSEAVTFKIDWETLRPDQEPPDVFATMGVGIKTPPDYNAEDLDIDDVVDIPQT